MTASFIDLPIEVMLKVTEHIKDVHTIKSMLSIKEVRHQLSKHTKIILDFNRKVPKLFPFHDAFEVIRTTDLKGFAPNRFIYLVEIDTSQKSFHSDKFFPGRTGVYTELSEVLKGYSGPNVFLCLTIISPLEYLPREAHMTPQNGTFLNVFNSLQFRSVHIKPSGDYFTFGYTPTPHTKYSITADAIVTSDVYFFLKNCRMKNPDQVPTFKDSQFTILPKFLSTALSIHSPFIISTDTRSMLRLPLDELFGNTPYCWTLTNKNWDDCKEMSMGLLWLVKDCTIEMTHGSIEIPEVSSFKDFNWDLKLEMCRSSTTHNGTRTYTLPKIVGLHSKSLSSLSIKSYDYFPSISDVHLPNISALSLELDSGEPNENTDDISLEAFHHSPIQYLSVNNLNLLKKCTFLPNLTHLEGITIKSSLELKEFNTLQFTHLESLVITTEIFGEVSTNAIKLQRLNWTSKSEISWGLNFLKKFAQLKALEIKAIEFKDSGKPQFPQLQTLSIEYLPANSMLRGLDKGNIAECDKWLPISAPKLENFTFNYDPERSKEHASLLLISLPSLEVVIFGNVRIVEVERCPKLRSMLQSASNKTALEKFTGTTDLPLLKFISHQDQLAVHTFGNDMAPVFMKIWYKDSILFSVKVFDFLKVEPKPDKPSFNVYKDPIAAIQQYKGYECVRWICGY